MESPQGIESEKTPHWRGYAWGLLAALTCPCHLGILAIVLAGTTVGAFLSDHWRIAAIVLTGLFLLSLARATQAFRHRSR